MTGSCHALKSPIINLLKNLVGASTTKLIWTSPMKWLKTLSMELLLCQVPFLSGNWQLLGGNITFLQGNIAPAWNVFEKITKMCLFFRPSASVSYEKDGVKKEILVEVVLDKRKPIPTIYITTPYSGYEHLILSGDFQARDHKWLRFFAHLKV